MGLSRRTVNAKDVKDLLLAYIRRCDEINVNDTEKFNIVCADIKKSLTKYTESNLGLVFDKRVENILTGISSGSFQNSKKLQVELTNLYNDFSQISKAA